MRTKGAQRTLLNVGASRPLKPRLLCRPQVRAGAEHWGTPNSTQTNHTNLFTHLFAETGDHLFHAVATDRSRHGNARYLLPSFGVLIISTFEKILLFNS